MSERQFLRHLRSEEVIDGIPKLPNAEDIKYGEIALNYAKGFETLSIKNNEDEIVSMGLKDEVYIGDVVEGSPDIFIDMSEDPEIEVYTKAQVDLIISSLEERIVNLENYINGSN